METTEMSILPSPIRVAHRVSPDESAPSRNERAVLGIPSVSAPAPVQDGTQKVERRASQAVSVLMHVLFALVGLLLVADLHSSYLAGSAKWETNPLMTVLAENVGARAALLGVKAVDFMCLAGMYAMWRRSRAHVVISAALATAAFVYVDIVLNNYSI
jgi:type IV secretory pathway VirB2 component (pilin)